MSETLELLFRIKSEGIDALDKTARSVNTVSLETKLASKELFGFDSVLKTLIADGDTHRQALEKISKSTNSLGKDYAGVAKELLNLDKAVQRSGDEAEKNGKRKEVAFLREEAALRRLSSAHDSANKENERRAQAAIQQNAGLAAGLKGTITSPLSTLGNGAESFALQYGAAGVAILGAGAAAAIAGKKVYDWANAMGEAAIEAQNLSARTGLSIEGAQLFAKAAELGGVNGNSLAASVKKISEALTENSEEGKKGKEVLREIGVSAYDASTGGLRDMDVLLPEIFSKLSKIPNAADRNVAAITLLGRSGKELLPLIANLQDLERAAKETGVILDTDASKSALDYRSNLLLLKFTVQGIEQDLAKLAITGAKALGFLKPVRTGKTPADLAAEELSEDNRRDLQPKIDENSRAIDKAIAKGRTPDDRAKELEKKITKLESDLDNRRDRTRDAKDPSNPKDRSNRELTGELDTLRSQLKTIEGKIQATKDYESALKQVESFEARIGKKSLNPVEQIFADRDELVRKNHLTGALRDRANDAATLAAQGEFKKLRSSKESQPFAETLREKRSEQKDFNISGYQALAETELPEGVETEKDVDAGLKRFGEQQLKRAKDIAAASQAVASIREAGQKSRLVGDLQQQGKIQSLQLSGPGQEKAAADAALQNRLAIAEQIKQTDLDRASQELTFEKRLEESERARETYKTEKRAAEREHEIQMLELDKQRRDEARQTAASFYDALKSGPGGISSFFKEEANNLGRGIFTNLAGPVIQRGFESIAKSIPGQETTDADGKKTRTPLGLALAGTRLDSTRQDNTSALLELTKATKENTGAHRSKEEVVQSVQKEGTPLAGVIRQSGDGPALAVILDGTSPLATPTPSSGPESSGPAQPNGSLALDSVLSDLSGVSLKTNSALKTFGSDINGLTGGLPKSITAAIGGAFSIAPLIRSLSASKPTATSDSTYDIPASGTYGGEYSTTSTPKTIPGLDKLTNLLSSPKIAGFTSGAVSHIGDFTGLATGVSNTANGAETLSASERVGAAAGTAGVIAAGAQGVASGIKQGGARGTLGAISSIAGTAAILDPEPISKAVLAGVAAVSGLVGSFLGDPKQQRATQIDRELRQNRYLAPTSLDLVSDSSGKYSDYDYKGNTRSSSFSILPVGVRDPSVQRYNGQDYILPGQQFFPFQPGPVEGNTPSPGYAGGRFGQTGNPTAPTVIIQVQTMDAKSFSDNADKIGAALQVHLNGPNGVGTTQTIRQATFPS